MQSSRPMLAGLVAGLVVGLAPAVAAAETPKSGGTLIYAVTAGAPSRGEEVRPAISIPEAPRPRCVASGAGEGCGVS